MKLQLNYFNVESFRNYFPSCIRCRHGRKAIKTNSKIERRQKLGKNRDVNIKQFLCHFHLALSLSRSLFLCVCTSIFCIHSTARHMAKVKCKIDSLSLYFISSFFFIIEYFGTFLIKLEQSKSLFNFSVIKSVLITAP
jgi:hypothetical protein